MSAVIEDLYNKYVTYFEQIPIRVHEATYTSHFYDEDFYPDSDGEYYEFEETTITVDECVKPRSYGFLLLKFQNEFLIEVKMRLKTKAERKQLAKLIFDFKNEILPNLKRDFELVDERVDSRKISTLLSMIYEVDVDKITRTNIFSYYKSQLQNFFNEENAVTERVVFSLDQNYFGVLTEDFKYNSFNLKNWEHHLDELDDLYYTLVSFEIIGKINRGAAHFRNMFNNQPVKEKFKWNRTVESFKGFIQLLYDTSSYKSSLLESYDYKYDTALNCFEVYTKNDKKITHKNSRILHKNKAIFDKVYVEDLNFHLSQIDKKNLKLEKIHAQVRKEVKKRM